MISWFYLKEPTDVCVSQIFSLKMNCYRWFVASGRVCFVREKNKIPRPGGKATTMTRFRNQEGYPCIKIVVDGSVMPGIGHG